MDNRPIGIFDSGLGGLTCVKEVMKVMPHEDIIYFGDTGRVPYGTRSHDTIVKYVRQDINFLKNFNIKHIIIACGTASSAALPLIREEYDISISGVLEPASAFAAEVSKNGRVAVLGTTGTVKSGKYTEVIKRLRPDFEVMQQACPLFVPLVENGYTSGIVAEKIAYEYLEPVREFAPDSLLLGCTHSPLLEKVIQKNVGDDVILINSGAAAALDAKRIITSSEMEGDNSKKGTVRYFVSDAADNFAELGGMFLGRDIDDKVEYVDIDRSR